MKRRALCLVLGLSLSLTACGRKYDFDDEDYDSQESNSVSSYSGDSVSEMLGGTDLEYMNSFNIDSIPADIDVKFTVNDADKLCIYNIEPITPDDINEDEIVSNIFGDTGRPITPDRKETLVEGEDSIFVMELGTTISTMNEDLDHVYSNKNSAWIDEDDYFVHIYEGKYNGIDYELLISFSENNGQLTTGLYPKNYSDVVQDPSLDKFYVSDLNGNLIIENNFQHFVNINEVMTDRPNKCTLSDDELIKNSTEGINNLTNMGIPVEAISLSAAGSLYLDNTDSDKDDSDKDEKSEAAKSELVYANETILGSANLEGAIRDGYQLYIMFNLCNQMVKLDTSEDQVNVFPLGTVDINDSGVVSFFMFASYKFGDKVTDTANILRFEEAMDIFVNESSKECEASDFTAANGGPIIYQDAHLCYVPVTQSDGTMQLTPAWELTAFSNKTRLVATTYINATDGSYIDSLSAKELGY